MEQFSLKKYLENPSRKVVTRDGREVEILKTNRKDNVHPIIFTVLDQNSIEQVHFCNKVGICTTLPSPNKFDLFFEDEEEKLNDFESKLYSTFSDIWQDYMLGNEIDVTKTVKEYSPELLDLARKEILKDFPMWKKCDDNLPYSHIGGLNERYLIKNGYCIKISDLEVLPKED